MAETENISTDARKEKLAAVFRKRASELAGRKTGESIKVKGITTVLVFSVRNERYALLLEDLAEVLPYDRCTPVPKSDENICGIINIRGKLCCVLELSGLLGLKLPKQKGQGYILILKKTRIGLKVHHVDQILSIQDKDRTEMQNEKHEFIANFSKGILLKNIVFLDINKIMSHPIFNLKGDRQS